MTLKLLKTLGFLILVTSFVAVAPAQVTLTLTAANPQAYAVYGNGGGVYTSPYTFTEVNNGVTTTNTLLSCDDFIDDVFIGESWQATDTSLQNNILGETSANQTVYFDRNSASNQQTQYSEVAYLAATLMSYASMHGGYGNQTAAELSFAIWSVFESSAVNTFLSNGVTDSNGHVLANFATDVANDVAAAATFVANPNNIVATEDIFTPIAGTQNPRNDPAPQEFIKVQGGNQFAPTPEPSFIAGLMIDLLFAIGLVLAFRRFSTSSLK